MGNLIRDFWTYQNYYGIVEVVGGSLTFRKADGKYETRIEKALDYMMKPNSKLLSHMSVQTYNDYLNKTGRFLRDDTDRAYYPFFIEMETKVKSDSSLVDWKHNKMAFDVQYAEMVKEAYFLVSYLIFEIGMHEKDILIMINNSRSVYIMINPLSYKLKPSRNLDVIYKEMFNNISQNVSLSYADKGMYKSNGLMKTPNCYYKGGYFVPISFNELRELQKMPELKGKLTRYKRKLNFDVPGVLCNPLVEIYEDAKEKIKEDTVALKDQQNYISSSDSCKSFKEDERGCVNYILKNEIEDGKKNFALVSVGYHFKSLGYTQEQTYGVMQEIADKWNYESSKRIYSKTKSIYRGKKKFKCDKAKDVLGIDECVCQNCPYNPHKDKMFAANNLPFFRIHKDLIDVLMKNKASLRHYIAYLQLSRKNLFNRWFSLETEGLKERTIKELCKLSGSYFIFSQSGDSVIIYNKNKDSQYRLLPNGFFDDNIFMQIGERLKYYLKLLFFGYKNGKSGNYVHTNVGFEKIKEIFGYKTINGVYKLMEKLKSLGFVVYKKRKLFSLYLISYKVVDILNVKEKRISRYKNITKFELMDNLAVGGEFNINSNSVRGSPDTG